MFRFDYSIIKNLDLDFNFPNGVPNHRETAIIATGKSALFMFEQFLLRHPFFIESPKFFVLPDSMDITPLSKKQNCDFVLSSHPHITEKSFLSGEKLINFVKNNSDRKYFIYLLSGGTSAMVEHGRNRDEIIRNNRSLLNSGKTIIEINNSRISLSDIKGGKLCSFAPESNWINFVMCDIPFKDGEKIVGSTPGWSAENSNSKLIQVADSNTLHRQISSYLISQNFKIVKKIQNYNGTVQNLAE